jgi:hypothetical protein
MAKGKRKEIPKGVRFEVLKRDKFTCQYCGAKAPDVLLNVDHVHAVAKGGGNDLLNLITACWPCNAGKGAKLLSDDSALTKQRAQLEELQARREQLDLLLQWKESLIDTQTEEIERVSAYWSKLSQGWTLTPQGLDTLRQIVRKYGAAEAIAAIDAAVQYLEVGADGKATKESVIKAWDYFPRIARMKSVHEENPHLKDLFYIRAVVRNRCSYFDGRRALDLLKRAHAAGAVVQDMKEIAFGAHNWTEWSGDMAKLISELEKA